MFNLRKAVCKGADCFFFLMHFKMNTKKQKVKQRKIKSNSKNALEFLKAQNPNLQSLINAFSLELSQSK